MTNRDDERLLAAMSAQADRAEAIKPKPLSLRLIAERLHEEFPHRAADEIETQCQVIWRDRHLFWN